MPSAAPPPNTVTPTIVTIVTAMPRAAPGKRFESDCATRARIRKSTRPPTKAETTCSTMTKTRPKPTPIQAAISPRLIAGRGGADGEGAGATGTTGMGAEVIGWVVQGKGDGEQGTGDRVG